MADFDKLNILAGTAKALEQAPITATDLEIFNRDFDLLVHKLIKVDDELGTNLAAEKEFYHGVNQVAKGYFNAKPFGGLKCSTGQYGMRLITPQTLKSSTGGQPKMYSWEQTVTTDDGDTDADILGGTSGPTWCYTETTKEQEQVIAFHTLISYSPDPKLILVQLNVNDYPYVPWSVEPLAKITKAEKLFKFIPMPGRIVIHPGGRFYIRGWFDLGTGLTAPSGTTDIDVEIAPFGLEFAEYPQLAAANLI